MPASAATALLGAALTLCAALFDAEPLYVPGMAFLVLAAAAVGWVRLGARGLRIEREVGARVVVEDEPVEITVRVRPGGVPVPAGAIVDGLLPQPAALAAGSTATVLHLHARFARRGRRFLPPPRVVVCDPLGLVSTEVVGDGPAELLVLPRIHPVVAAPAGADGDQLGLVRGRPWVAAEIDLDGVRPLRAGTPASRIVWPAFARGGELIERRLRADSDTRPLVVLDPRGAADPADLDAAVRAAGSLAVHLARSGGCALLLPGDRRPVGIERTLAGWDRLHVRLALVEGGRPPALGVLGTRRGAIVYVAARRDARAPRALLGAVGGGRVLVVPGAREGRAAAFTVAGCTGYELSPRHAAREVA